MYVFAWGPRDVSLKMRSSPSSGVLLQLTSRTIISRRVSVGSKSGTRDCFSWIKYDFTWCTFVFLFTVSEVDVRIVTRRYTLICIENVMLLNVRWLSRKLEICSPLSTFGRSLGPALTELLFHLLHKTRLTCPHYLCTLPPSIKLKLLPNWLDTHNGWICEPLVIGSLRTSSYQF
jgi:hypothetical protein